jgi:hypothetical protein
MKILETAGLVLLSQGAIFLGLAGTSTASNVVKLAGTKTMEKPFFIHQRIQNFQFSDRISFRTQGQVTKNQVLSVLGRDRKSILDFTTELSRDLRTSTPYKDTLRYKFRISELNIFPLVLGNLADLTLDIKGTILKPGVYRFRSKQANAIQDLSIFSRELYSDPSHAQWGCARWGEASLTIKKVQYGSDRKIKGLETSLSQICAQTKDLPIQRPQDHKPDKRVEPVQTYTYYATLKFQL